VGVPVLLACIVPPSGTAHHVLLFLRRSTAMLLLLRRGIHTLIHAAATGLVHSGRRHILLLARLCLVAPCTCRIRCLVGHGVCGLVLLPLPLKRTPPPTSPTPSSASPTPSSAIPSTVTVAIRVAWAIPSSVSWPTIAAAVPSTVLGRLVHWDRGICSRGTTSTLLPRSDIHTFVRGPGLVCCCGVHGLLLHGRHILRLLLLLLGRLRLRRRRRGRRGSPLLCRRAGGRRSLLGGCGRRCRGRRGTTLLSGRRSSRGLVLWLLLLLEATQISCGDTHGDGKDRSGKREAFEILHCVVAVCVCVYVYINKGWA
jgi:hypothetical protein